MRVFMLEACSESLGLDARWLSVDVILRAWFMCVCVGCKD